MRFECGLQLRQLHASLKHSFVYGRGAFLRHRGERRAVCDTLSARRPRDRLSGLRGGPAARPPAAPAAVRAEGGEHYRTLRASRHCVSTRVHRQLATRVGAADPVGSSGARRLLLLGLLRELLGSGAALHGRYLCNRQLIGIHVSVHQLIVNSSKMCSC